MLRPGRRPGLAPSLFALGIAVVITLGPTALAVKGLCPHMDGSRGRDPQAVSQPNSSESAHSMHGHHHTTPLGAPNAVLQSCCDHLRALLAREGVPAPALEEFAVSFVVAAYVSDVSFPHDPPLFGIRRPPRS